MVSLDQLQENRARADAGMNKENVIVHHKVLRKALLKVFYAESVDEIMKVVSLCDMEEPESEPEKQIFTVGEIFSPADILDLH